MNPEPHPKAMAFNNTQSSVGQGLSDEVREAAIARADAALVAALDRGDKQGAKLAFDIYKRLTQGAKR